MSYASNSNSENNTHFPWEGDMLVKNTLVFFGSMFNLTHLSILFIAIRYASSVESSTISFTSSSKDPSLKILRTNQILFSTS